MLEFARQDCLEHRRAARHADDLTDVAEEVCQTGGCRHVGTIHTRDQGDCDAGRVSVPADERTRNRYSLSPAVMTEANPKPLGRIESHV